MLDLLTELRCCVMRMGGVSAAQVALGQSYDIQKDAMLYIPDAPLMKAPYVPVYYVHCVTDVATMMVPLPHRISTALWSGCRSKCASMC